MPTRTTLALALVVSAVGALAAACGGGGTNTAGPETEQLSDAIARFTGLPSGEAETVASSVRTSSPDALTALASIVDEQPPLPSDAALATDLEAMGQDEGFDGDAALADLCKAILAEPLPQPTDEPGTTSAAPDVHWSGGDPALWFGRAVDQAAVAILNRRFGSAGYEAIFLEQFEDRLADRAAKGVAESSDPTRVLLWLRLQQLRSGACAEAA